MNRMTISRLARSAGVGVETVRFYQRQGLLETPQRPSGAAGEGVTRRYGDGHLRSLRFIRSAKLAGFTLEEIRELIELDATNDRSRARDLARSRLEALDRKLAELEAAREALRHLEKECSVGSKGPCPIISSFERFGSQRAEAE